MKRWLVILLVACGREEPLPLVLPSTGEVVKPYAPPEVKSDHSLFWNDPLLLDDAQLVSFAKVMGIIAPDGHGGALLDHWFRLYRLSPRAKPEGLMDQIAAAQGADPTKWDLSLIAFKVTGVHNRIDLADYGPNGHCGELRVSMVSTELDLQDFHMLFIFRQPREAGDESCAKTAQKWAELSRLDGAPLRDAVRALLREGFTRERFLLIETVELTTQPWEWRQWVKGPPGAGLPFTLENPPLFQQVDVEGLNAPGPKRDEFLAWVQANAAALEARTQLIDKQFRAPTVHVVDGVPRTPLSLGTVGTASLRKNIELVGCAACHTTNASFVQTKADRTVSPFYEKELEARERHLEKMSRGEKPFAPFGPLQADPLLPD